MRLAFVYAALALIATMANLLAQEAVMRAWPWASDAHAVAFSMVFGAVVGLIAKYVLDKRYVFAFKAKNHAHEGITFALYTAMGLFTTALFWGFELGFHFAFGSPGMKYFGAVIGLGLGYVVKFNLDKRFVFRLSN